MRKFICLLLILTVFVLSIPIHTLADSDIKVIVDGKTLTFDQPPIMQNERVLVPMRAIFEALNSKVEWDENTQTVTAERDELTVKVTIGKPEIIINGTVKQLDVAPVVLNDRTLVPVRAVSEAFNAEVKWDEASQTVIIATAGTNETGDEEMDPFNGKYYRITPANTNKSISVENSSMDDGAKIVVVDTEENDSQIWTFLLKEQNYYTITNKKSKKIIDVPGVSTEAGKGLIQYSANGGDNQSFKLIKNTDGSYSLQAKHSGLYWTVTDGVITQETFTGNENQRFILNYIGESDVELMGLGATLFLLKGENMVSNVKLHWNSVPGATRYELFRSVDNSTYELLDSLTGVSYDDYELKLGSKYKYYVKAFNGKRLIASAESEECVPYELPSDLETFSNITPSSLKRPNPLYSNGVYYRFSFRGRSDGGKGFGQLIMTTSTDGINYDNEKEVMNIQDVLNNPTCEGLKDCKFESNNFLYNPKTNKIILWSHFEEADGYGLARVSVAYATPGERFVFSKSFRPEGDDARDLNIYVDDDGSAYLTAAINMNADLAIYKLTPDWTDVEKKLTIANKGKHRELPGILHKDGLYYLFSSGTAGWYPTQGMYNTATSLEGPWSELQKAGNNSTFSAQSGTIYRLRQENGSKYLMLAYRWMSHWKDANMNSNPTRVYPITLANGFAFYEFYNEVLYNVANDILIPVQNGRLLSQGKPASASSNSDSAFIVNDGDYQTIWKAEKEWPTTWTVDLGAEYSLSEIQISWFTQQGSEAYYNYKIEGSTDGVNYTTILDRSSGYTDYCFTVDALSGKARYVRLNILDAKLNNNPSNWYTPQLYEVKVFGY